MLPKNKPTLQSILQRGRKPVKDANNTITKTKTRSSTKITIIILLLLIILCWGCLDLIQYLKMNSIYINISNWANIHKDNITNTSINTHYIEPDIDYSIRKRFNHKMVNRIGLIEDRIANTSFIFYHSSMLGWVKVDPGEKYVRTVFSIVLSNNINILSSSIMIDIGANMGYYGILSLSMGIGKAIFFEPQPACVQIIESLVTLNAFNQRARIINHPIGNGKLLEVPSMECDGRFPINKQENGKVNAYGNNNEND
eukprot:338494_1